MNYIPAPMPENEARRQEAVERLQIKGTDQHGWTSTKEGLSFIEENSKATPC